MDTVLLTRYSDLEDAAKRLGKCEPIHLSQDWARALRDVADACQAIEDRKKEIMSRNLLALRSL